MGWRNDAQSYGSVAQRLHWLRPRSVLSAWLIGCRGRRLLSQSPGRPRSCSPTFPSASSCWRAVRRPGLAVGRSPSAPDRDAVRSMEADAAALVVHVLLYALLLMVPLVAGIGLQVHTRPTGAAVRPLRDRVTLGARPRLARLGEEMHALAFQCPARPGPGVRSGASRACRLAHSVERRLYRHLSRGRGGCLRWQKASASRCLLRRLRAPACGRAIPSSPVPSS